MFGTSIHWTTFFYVLVDLFLVLFASIQCFRLKNFGLESYIILGFLYILYDLTGGFLPFKNFPAPLIVQYIITYGIAIALCIYVIYYLYKEYDIVIVAFPFSIRNIVFLVCSFFILLFLCPYYISGSLSVARFTFTIPISLIGFYFLWLFFRRIKQYPKSNRFTLRRNKLSIISVSCIILLPILTEIGDYQWLTFSIMNFSFYCITAIEVNRYLYLLENKNKIFEVFAFNNLHKKKLGKFELLYKNLTRREIEVAVSIMSDHSYKKIGEELFIAEGTVSKHASNIFKKIRVKDRDHFMLKFRKKSN